MQSVQSGSQLRDIMEHGGVRLKFAAAAVVWTTVVPTPMMVDMSAAPSAKVDRKRFASPEQEAFLSLWRTYDRLRMLEDELFSRFDLTAQQYNVLRILHAARPDPLPTLALAERLISRAPDITRIIDRLAERGLVERQRDAANRRVVPIAITSNGAALLAEIAGPLRECHARQLGHLSKSDLAQLTALLRAARAPHETPDSAWG